jgi:Resolvase, N terminal domain
MGKRAAIYLRFPTDEQTTENQERALREVAARSGHEIVAVYRDEGISGSKGRDKRPGLLPCTRTPAGASSISSWHGRWIGSAARCKT